MLGERFSFGARLLAVALLAAGPLAAGPTAARAAQSDCQEPASRTPVFGCVWAGPNYTGAMTLYEGASRNAKTGCFSGSPRSAANNGPASGADRYVFAFYHHPGCEKGGKPFGFLGPGASDPDLQSVQSYAWDRYRG